jgi:mRNA-degrading endonuclease toxin of MazEF toxin-antitoxin module
MKECRSRHAHRYQYGPDLELRRLNRRIRDWNSARPVPINAFRQGVVVWADVPYADGTGSKGRPAVIIDASGSTVTLLPVTSSLSRRRFPWTCVELSGWDEAGLNRPCAVQHRLVQVDRCAVTEILGALNPYDHSVVCAWSPIAA